LGWIRIILPDLNYNKIEGQVFSTFFHDNFKNNFRENRFILRNGQPPSMVLRPREAPLQQNNNAEDAEGNILPEQLEAALPFVQGNLPANGLGAPNAAEGMVADLGVVPPLPNVPPVSVHYREEQDFEWGPGRDRILQTGGPGGQNHLLTPLLNKETGTYVGF
jgi:hypothetical protein